MKNARVAFEACKEDVEICIGYKEITGYLLFVSNYSKTFVEG